MRIYLVAGAVLALSACGGDRAAQTNAANMSTSDNMMMDQNMAMDPMMKGTGNMAMDPMMNGMVDPATQNMMEKDMNTNAPDTNLANGL